MPDNPGQALETLMRGFWHSRILLAGVELGIFDALARRPLGQDELASELRLDPRATEILLGSLAALGLIEPEAGRYRLPDRWAELLMRDSPHSQASIIMHMRQMWESWGRLDEVARRGRRRATPPADTAAEQAQTRAFIAGMHEVSRHSARELAMRLEGRPFERMLDVGGGPGTYCIELARKRPALRAVLLDRPLPLEVARERIEAAGLEERIERRPGDALEADYGHDYDLVLVSQLLHAFGPADGSRIIARAARALKPGGLLLVNEFALHDIPWAPPHAAVFAVNMLVNTDEGRAYAISEIEGWMREAGLTGLCHEELGGGRSTLFYGTRP